MMKPLTFKNIWGWAMLTFLVVLGPLLLAWLATPPGYIFLGTLANHNDFNTYVAAIRQGAEGKWLFHFSSSPEYWQPQLMLPLYMVLGKIVPGAWGYVLWAGVLRFIALGAVLVTFVAWVKQIFPKSIQTQWNAWFLLIFGSGFGWILWPAANLFDIPITTGLFPDMTDTGWTLSLIGSNGPHYMVGLFLETLFFLFFWRVINRFNWKAVIAAAITAFLLGIIYVYNSTVLFATLGLYLLWDVIEKKKIDRQLWLASSLTLMPLFPLLFYYGYWVNQDPAWAQYVISAENHIPPPPWFALLAGAGLVGLLAIIGASRWWKSPQNRLILFWVFGTIFVMYVPFVQYTGRFILGLWVPIATLAAYSLEEIILPYFASTTWYPRFARLTPTPYASLRRSLIILTTPTTILVALMFIKNIGQYQDFPFYLPKTEVQALTWLAENTNPEKDLILTYYPAGNYYPVLSNTRVFMGQFFTTVNYRSKLEDVEMFWNQETPAAWQQEFLQKWQITYIYQGRYENQLSNGSFSPPGTLVYNRGGVKIYQVLYP